MFNYMLESNDNVINIRNVAKCQRVLACVCPTTCRQPLIDKLHVTCVKLMFSLRNHLCVRFPIVASCYTQSFQQSCMTLDSRVRNVHALTALLYYDKESFSYCKNTGESYMVYQRINVNNCHFITQLLPVP